MSISVQEAFETVKKKIPEDIMIRGCTDIGDSFVFSTNPKGMKEIAPGGISYQVMKSDGKICYFDDLHDNSKYDPYENIKRLINGKEVKLPE